MKVNLITFQDKAVKELRVDIADALDSYRRRGKRRSFPCRRPPAQVKPLLLHR